MVPVRRPTLLRCVQMVSSAHHPLRAIAVAVAACAVAVSACTTSGESMPETTATTTTTTTPVVEQADGQLTIGLLLPTSDPLGQGLIAAAEEAVARINAAGGVLGQPVRVVSRDEGTGEGTAAASITSLLDADVDAVVGPSSSLTALSDLDTLVAAGVATCSPTASALALDDFPDNRLFFRTVPSDSLQATAIADRAERTGVQDIAVVYVDDAYGRPFAAAVSDELRSVDRAVASLKTYGFSRSDADVSSVARQVAGSDAQVMILLSGAEDGAAFLEALEDTDFTGLSRILVNDQLRAPGITQRVEALDPDLRSLVEGVAPQAQSNDPDRPFDPPGLFAANAFDCVNLIALAAVSAQSDDPAVFASQIPALTVVGRTCDSFESCSALLRQSLNINYNGPDGITELLSSGDPARAWFDSFVFDDSGRDVVDDSLLISRR